MPNEYTHVTTVDWDADPLEAVIDGLLAGEKYDVRIRSETDDATGEWHEASEITALEPVENLEATQIDQNDATVGWGTTVEFEGSQQIWFKREDYSYDDERGELIATVDTETESFDLDGLYPDREYTVSVRSLTQYVSATTSTTFTTESAGLAQHAAPPRGWHVELEHPSGRTLTPQILDDAMLAPQVNGLPEVRIPVPRDETHFHDSLEGAPMHVWRDGQRRPIDELEDVVAKPGHDEFVGRGATQLERRVQTDVIVEPAHELVERLIEEHTDYVANVDVPVSEQHESLAQNPSTADDWASVTEFTALDDYPFEIDTDNETFELSDSNILADLSRGSIWDNQGTSTTNDDRFANGSARVFDNDGEAVEYLLDQTVEYTIPEDHVRIAMRVEGDSGNGLLEATLIDHETDENVASFTLWNGDTGSSLIWYSHEDIPQADAPDVLGTGGVQEWNAGDIPPGEYRLRVEADILESEFRIDLVSIHDDRYEYLFDNDTTVPSSANPYLDGPELKPDRATIILDQYPAVFSVAGGTLEVDIDETSGDQSVAISNDAIDWIREYDSTTVSGEFEDLSGELFVELGLARTGDAGAGETPRYGQDSQSISSYELTALLDDTPLVINRNYDGDLKDVLAEIADDADSLYEARQDGDQTTIEWAQPGQRSADGTPPVEDYEVTKESRRILKATVRGGRTSIEGEEVVADADGPVELEESNIIAGTERVQSADDGTRYRANLDYQLRTGDGELDIRGSGGIVDGEELVIDYDYNVDGSYEHDDYDGDPRTEITENIPQASNERACGQAAKVLVNELSEPRYEANISIPASEDLDGLLEALNFEEIPGDAMSVYENDELPEGLQLRLGSRPRVADTVSRIQSRLSATSKRV